MNELATLAQLDALEHDLAGDLETALTAGADGHVELLQQISAAVAERRKETVDKLVRFLMLLEAQRLAAKMQGDLFTVRAESIGNSLDTIRRHIQTAIDGEAVSSDPATRRLLGNTCKAWTQRNPSESLEITGEVPAEFLSMTIEVRVPVPDLTKLTAEQMLDNFADLIGEFCSDGTWCRWSTNPDETPRAAPDEHRIRLYLKDHTVPWAKLETGRHLRQSPSLKEVERGVRAMAPASHGFRTLGAQPTSTAGLRPEPHQK